MIIKQTTKNIGIYVAVGLFVLISTIAIKKVFFKSDMAAISDPQTVIGKNIASNSPDAKIGAPKQSYRPKLNRTVKVPAYEENEPERLTSPMLEKMKKKEALRKAKFNEKLIRERERQNMASISTPEEISKEKETKEDDVESFINLNRMIRVRGFSKGGPKN